MISWELSLILHFIASFASWTSSGETLARSWNQSQEVGDKKLRFVIPGQWKRHLWIQGWSRFLLEAIYKECVPDDSLYTTQSRVTADVTLHPGHPCYPDPKLNPGSRQEWFPYFIRAEGWKPPDNSFGGLGVNVDSINIWIWNQRTFLAGFLLKKSRILGKKAPFTSSQGGDLQGRWGCLK